MDDYISRQAAIDALNRIINRFEQILRDIRESKVDDSVCGMCEYDGAFVGQSGDWCNECPGFEKDDCFKLSDECRKRWLESVELPSVHPGCDEWCHNCKEYDQQKHCCPRWNRVIRQTVEDVRKEIPETTRILAEVLTGSPLLHPCDKLWSREGWCKDHCKKGQTEPDTECWLKYAETIAAERRGDKR